MDKWELEFIAKYTRRISAHDGDPSVLSKAERDHLALLMRKYQLENQSGELAKKLGQGTLFDSPGGI